MNKKLLAGFVSILAAGSINTHAYQFEAGLTHGNADSDAGIIDLDQEETSFVASYFFSDVEASQGPLAAATFMERTSLVSASYSDGELDSGPLELNTDEHTIYGRYVDEKSGWLVTAGYSNAETDTIDAEIDNHSLAVGKYIAQYTTLMLGYSKSELEIGSLSEDAKTLDLSLSHLQPMDNGMYFGFNASINSLDADDNDEDATGINIGANLYLTDNIGLGVDLSRVDSDDGDVNSYTIHGEWFVTDELALSVNYTSSDESGSVINIDTDTVVAGIRVRF